MRFQLDITITEEDYVAFNDFHSLKSKAGKKLVRNSRIFFAACIVFVLIFVVMAQGWTTFSVVYLILMGAFAVLYVLFFPKILKRNIKKQIDRMKKTGKLPFDPVARWEFYEDKFVEVTPNKRTEQSYGVLERICVEADRYIYLYQSSVGANIIPIPQLRAQLDQGEFVSFLSQKCNNIEYY